MSENKILGLLGIAEKSGKLASGEFSAEQALKTRKACLTIVADDASENTKKKFRDKCEHVRCPILVLSSKRELAHAIGKEERSCVAVLDRGLAAAISRAAESITDNRGE